MITEEFTANVLEFYSNELLNRAPKHKIELTRQWALQFPDVAGIYAVFSDDKVIYVGETGKISGRLMDFLNTRHHTLRRSLGAGLFSKEPGFKLASSAKKFPDHIETKVINALKTLQVAVLPILLGRSEIEEYIIETQKPLFNQKAKRQ